MSSCNALGALDGRVDAVDGDRIRVRGVDGVGCRSCGLGVGVDLNVQLGLDGR